MAESKLRELSVDFAVKIIKLCGTIKGHYSLVNQLERSATSIGANLHEAKYAQSRADFIHKLEIALKESSETEYWIELLLRKGKIASEQSILITKLAGSIRRRLIASITTAKSNERP